MKIYNIVNYVTVLLSLLSTGCSENLDEAVQQPVQSVVTVGLTLNMEEGLTAGGTRAVSPLIPDKENFISDIWVIQYDMHGVIRNQFTRHYRETVDVPPALQLESFPIDLAVLNDCTVCLIVNRNPHQTNLISPWKNTFEEFKEQYLDINYLSESGNSGLPDVDLLPMFGYWQGDITASTTSLSVLLGRMLARVNLVVENATSAALSDVNVSISNAVRRAYYYPLSVNAAFAASAYTSFSDAIGTLAAGEKAYLYYYLAPNIAPVSGDETTVTVQAVKEGMVRSTAAVALGSTPDEPSIYRNYNYTITLSLK